MEIERELHPALEPLKFLIGEWISVSADGKYLPRVAPFNYCEKLTFTSIGQPMLNFNSVSWHPVKKTTMHQESGFLKIKPGTTEVSFIIAHNFGLTTIEEGNVVDNKLMIKSKQISRSSFCKDPSVAQIERSYELKSNGQLEIKVNMATSLNPELSEHLVALYEKTV